MSRSVEVLHPLEPGHIKLYCCGPTVYHYAHIGNLRSYLFEDLLVRTLKKASLKVTHVMNITDVGHLAGDGDAGDDKMAIAMKREKKRSFEVAEFYTNAFFDDCTTLNICRPDVVCKATDHIKEMIELIKRLEANGCTYVNGGNVYFDISKAKDYGKLAKLDLAKLEAGARIAVDPLKKHAHDFALWFTNSKFESQELQWESPWGTGYPGWHIECSAMAIKYLGEEFDIHCGGVDHIPVHHTNEIAQSECATKKPWVKVWMHGGFLVNENKEKMAKSAGGFTRMIDISEKGVDPVAFRLLCLGTHYRTQMSYSWDAVLGAAQSLERLKNVVISWKALGTPARNLSPTGAQANKAFSECFFNDLNAPQAMAVLWGVVSEKSLESNEKLALLLAFDDILGLGVSSWTEQKDEIPAEVLELAEKRIAARASKNWAESDRLRDEITKRGFVVQDGAQNAKVKKA